MLKNHIKYLLLIFLFFFFLIDVSFKTYADVVVSFTQEIKPMEDKEYAKQKKIVDAKKERTKERTQKLKELEVDRKIGKVYGSSDVTEISKDVINNLDTTDDLLIDSNSNQFEYMGSNTTGLNSPIGYICNNNKDPG